MDEGIGNHLHLIHITNDFACLGCYKLLYEIRGANGDTWYKPITTVTQRPLTPY